MEGWSTTTPSNCCSSPTEKTAETAFLPLAEVLWESFVAHELAACGQERIFGRAVCRRSSLSLVRAFVLIADISAICDPLFYGLSDEETFESSTAC